MISLISRVVAAHQLQEAKQVVVVGDRESDIYEELVMVPNLGCDLLIRSSKDRALYDRETTLFSYMASLTPAGEMTIEIKGNKKRKNRMAQLEIRYSRIKIACPKRRAGNPLPPYVEINAIEIREKAESVPEGEDPIIWRLLTTLEIRDITDACLYAYWYS